LIAYRSRHCSHFNDGFTTVAASQQFSGMELLQSVLKLVFFLTAWFVGGIFFIPTLLKKS
jgi:CPA2 family monovalent cation:H+ antiporter-2